jgi:hypothetical protein
MPVASDGYGPVSPDSFEEKSLEPAPSAPGPQTPGRFNSKKTGATWGRLLEVWPRLRCAVQEGKHNPYEEEQEEEKTSSHSTNNLQKNFRNTTTLA